MISKRKIGFTLIELLVVVAIIGVLTAVLLVNLVGIRERAADTKKKSDLTQMKNAIRLYYNDNQSYPPSSADSIQACNNLACAVGAEMNDGAGTIYMQSVPEYDTYWVSGDGESYYVGVALANASDQDAIDSYNKCDAFIDEETEGIFYICSE